MVEKIVDQIEQDFARFKQPAMAVTGGIAAALVVATLPHVYLEDIVGATGLSEIIPAAAPPLGNTARGLIAVVAGMISASALYLFLNHKPKFQEGGSDMSLAIRKKLLAESLEEGRESKSRFAVPKLNFSAKSLTKFLKKPKKSPGQVTELKDLPNVRSADSHPDAPARQPIFASSDLGAPLAETIKRFDQAETGKANAESIASPEAAVAPQAPIVADPVAHSPQESQPAPDVDEDIAQAEETTSRNADLSGMSLAQLADRLEAGLRRLEALEAREEIPMPATSRQSEPSAESRVALVEAGEAMAPVAIPPLRSVEPAEIEVTDSRQADMDAALKAALGTLEKMTAQR
jgi:hypothetical protein